MDEHKPTGREIELGPRPERPEEPGPRDIVITPPVMEGMVLVPAGEFILGTSEQEIERLLRENSVWKRDWFRVEMPQRKVYLDAYYIGIYQVTNARFREFVRDTGYLELDNPQFAIRNGLSASHRGGVGEGGPWDRWEDIPLG